MVVERKGYAVVGIVHHAPNALLHLCGVPWGYRFIEAVLREVWELATIRLHSGVTIMYARVCARKGVKGGRELVTLHFTGLYKKFFYYT